MNSNIKKYIVGAVIIVAFVAYLIFNNDNSQVLVSANPTPSTKTPSPITAGTTGPNTTPNSTTPPAGTPPAAPATTPTTNPSAPAGQYKNGTYTGPVADAFYGNLQATAIIQGGKLTDVQFPQSPQERGHSQQVAAMALPILKQEAIAAQSANVDIVSGATADSQAFQQSLGAALAAAK
jgi:uncharacterized protein with FMN-binding domain